MNSVERKSGRRVIASVGFYLVLIAVAIGAGLLTHRINSRPFFAPYASDPAALSRAEDTYAAAGNLLTTLATGLLAGLAWFFTSRPKERYSARDIWPAVVAAACACLSIYFGYVSSQNIQWAIENSIGTLDLPKLMWPRQVQFYAILLSVFFFADFVRRDWREVD